MTDFLFRLGLIIKGIDAILEVIGGVLLLSPLRVDRMIEFLLQHELYNSVRHPTTAHLQHAAAEALAKATLAGAIYLIVHGSAKTILILAVFKDKKWGYIGLVAVLSVFTVIEVVKGVMDHSALAGALAAFDLFIVYLIGKEYKTHFLKRTIGEA
jgi:uncharacterized membrane protein